MRHSDGQVRRRQLACVACQAAHHTYLTMWKGRSRSCAMKVWYATHRRMRVARRALRSRPVTLRTLRQFLCSTCTGLSFSKVFVPLVHWHA